MRFLWKEGVKPSPIVSYLQFVVREHLDAVLLSWVWGF